MDHVLKILNFLGHLFFALLEFILGKILLTDKLAVYGLEFLHLLHVFARFFLNLGKCGGQMRNCLHLCGGLRHQCLKLRAKLNIGGVKRLDLLVCFHNFVFLRF